MPGGPDAKFHFPKPIKQSVAQIKNSKIRSETIERKIQRKFGGHATQKVAHKNAQFIFRKQRTTHQIVFGRHPNWVGGGVYLFLL